MAHSSQRHLLRPDELRLLNVDRRLAGSPEALIFHTDWLTRTAAPRYTAISYTWGEQPKERLILIDGQATKISSNLWYCLFNVCHHTDWDHIWVDALCINQEDDLEKSGQVREMGATYHDAECVAAWLGGERESDGPVPTEMSTVKEVDDTDLADSAWSWEEELAQLSRRRYWSRRWIAQELFHARRIEIFCGPHRLPWCQFETLLDQHGEALSHLQGPGTIGKLLRGRDSTSTPLEMLMNLQHLCCKDERDRIYALLSLFPAAHRKSLAPNYARTYETVVIRLLVLVYAHTWPNTEIFNKYAGRIGEALGLDISRFLRLLQRFSSDTRYRWYNGVCHWQVADYFLDLEVTKWESSARHLGANTSFD